MTWKYYDVGIHNVGSYQVSGWPWITGSAISANAEHKIEFPYVTKELTVIKKDAGGTLRIHFQATGSGNVVGGRHYIELESDESSFTYTCKTKEIYISEGSGTASNYTVIAELTNIDRSRIQGNLTGSGITD